jgi:hypothetical protein
MSYMLGASCSKCCGEPPPPEGWYCCPEPNCMMDSITSIYVTITPASSEYIRMYRARATNCPQGYDQYTVAVPCDSVRGTHKLNRISETLWSATLPVDSIGCLSPSISFTLSQKISTSSGRWLLSIKNPAYYWYQTTTIGNDRFKSLSEMSCTTSPPWTGRFWDCSRYVANFQEYSARLLVGISDGRDFTCIAKSTSLSGDLGYISPNILLDLEGPEPSPYDVYSISGSLSCEIKIEIL